MEGWNRQVIGYSDGRDFAVGVGPSPAASQSEGRFADLVQQVVIRKAPTPAQREKHPGPTPASPTTREGEDDGEPKPELPKKARAVSPRTKARLSADALRMYEARQGQLYGALPRARERNEETAVSVGGPGIEPSASAGPRTLYDFLPPAREKNLQEEAQPGIEPSTSSGADAATFTKRTDRHGGGTSESREGDGMNGGGPAGPDGRNHEGLGGKGTSSQGTPGPLRNGGGDGDDDMFAADSEGPS